ncbi:MAG: VOC family protein [Ignavibacteria bacterium]|nr:VOC family protein [Ignavibacteria bacterium]
MITKLKSVVLLVHDQEEALNFFTQKLGFELHTDAKFGEDNRWLTVSVPGQKNIEIALERARTTQAKATVGKQMTGGTSLLGFYTKNIKKDVESFKRNGVEIVGDIVEMPVGKFMVFKDLYGNQFYLHEEN